MTWSHEDRQEATTKHGWIIAEDYVYIADDNDPGAYNIETSAELTKAFYDKLSKLIDGGDTLALRAYQHLITRQMLGKPVKIEYLRRAVPA